MTTEDLLVEDRLCQGVQTIEAESHVDGAERHEYTRGWRNAQHRGPRNNRATSFVQNASRQRMVRPSGLTISMAQMLVGATIGGAARISLNTTGVGTFEERFALVNHQSSVARGIPDRRANAARVRPLQRNSSTICSRRAAGMRRCRGAIRSISMPRG
jgi:hypothetical protein